MGKKKKNSFKKYFFGFLVIVLTGTMIVGYNYYQKFISPNVVLSNEDNQTYLYIPTGSDFNQLVTILESKNAIKNTSSFVWVAKQLKYDINVRPGRYQLKKGMSNLDLIRLLRSGKQSPVRLVLNKYRTKDQLVTAVCKKIEADSNVLRVALNDDVFLKAFNFNSQTVMAMFIPNTYEFYWNTDVREFLDKMNKEYLNFWTTNKRQLADRKNLSLIQVSIIASIVEEETNANDEKDEVASVYLNRLRIGMLLQADPTVKYALQNFGLRRVMSIHTQFDSPYNTYKYTGLPPGPICNPSLSSIDAVLNASDTDYIYFCASPDQIGKHSFASNYTEHLKNASRYQHYLNSRGIK